jgi:N-methylhydantoinase B
VLTEFRPVDCDIEIGFVSDGTVNPALGARSGQPAIPARQFLLADSGTVTPLGTSEQVAIRNDQLMVSYSNGGGGFGDPAKRDPEKVAEDAREGWISAARAMTVYKVALDETGRVDVVATAALRA